MKQVSIHPVVTGEELRVTNEEPVRTTSRSEYAVVVGLVVAIITLVLRLL